MSKGNDNHIQVFCRLRPLNSLEKQMGGEICLDFTNSSIKMKVL